MGRAIYHCFDRGYSLRKVAIYRLGFTIFREWIATWFTPPQDDEPPRDVHHPPIPGMFVEFE
jgi:hypothetical protein